MNTYDPFPTCPACHELISWDSRMVNGKKVCVSCADIAEDAMFEQQRDRELEEKIQKYNKGVVDSVIALFD